MENDQDEAKGHFRNYTDKQFNDKSLKLIGISNVVIEHYESLGLPLTLRQLYYQLVTKNVFANQESSYDRLGRLISEGRMAGLVSWTAIEDRGRTLRGHEYQQTPHGALRDALRVYRLEKWADQEWRPEVWIEKQALEGVIGTICSELEVDFFAVKGYNSQSNQWRAGRRFAEYVRKGQRPIVFHLGDHDPSGLDMTRDNRERLELFAGTPVIVQRLALNMDQIEKFKPPPNPAKDTDPRYDEYERVYRTRSSWELDALEPTHIQALIRDAVMRVRDEHKWAEALKAEVADKLVLEEMCELLGGKG